MLSVLDLDIRNQLFHTLKILYVLIILSLIFSYIFFYPLIYFRYNFFNLKEYVCTFFTTNFIFKIILHYF